MPSALVPFFVYILACLIVAVTASRRTIGFWGGVALSVVVTPLLAAVILVLTRPRRRFREVSAAAPPPAPAPAQAPAQAPASVPAR